MGSSLREALLDSPAFRRLPPGVMGIWQLRSHGAAINGVLDHPVDGGIGRPTPGHIPIRLLHGQIEIMLMEPKPPLAPAARPLALVKGERDALLPPPVRILLVTVAVLHEAN